MTESMTVTVYRNDGGCRNCGHYVARDDLLDCYGDGEKMDEACPNCFVPHFQ